MSLDENDSEARPGLAPPEPPPLSTQVLEVNGERFLLDEHRPVGDRHEYGYEWLAGPNPGYGFGPEMSRTEHEFCFHQFLDGIDPETGYLSERIDPPAT